MRLASSRSTFTHLTDSVSMSSSSSLVPTSSTSRGTVYDLNRLVSEQFDYVLFWGVLYHCAIPCSRSTRFDPCSLRTA